jgi:ubiquinone/menaquinone biosynthesis C-methylase UbiE
MINFRKFLPRTLYWYVSFFDNKADVLFMNYGYSDPEQKIDLHPEEEPHRYSIQLYHYMTEGIDFRNKAVVEVGCGRGGGMSYIVNRWAPASAIGIDLCKEAVRFCNNHYQLRGLSFLHGDAQNLPLENESCDILVNVESSHRYENIERFFAEVHRVLRDGGLFLFADYRSKKKLPTLRKVMELASFKVIKEEFINLQVVSALEKDWDKKFQVYKKFAPRFLHNIGQNCAYKIQSRLIEKFRSNRKIYFYYILQKQCV